MDEDILKTDPLYIALSLEQWLGNMAEWPCPRETVQYLQLPCMYASIFLAERFESLISLGFSFLNTTVYFSSLNCVLSAASSSFSPYQFCVYSAMSFDGFF